MIVEMVNDEAFSALEGGQVPEEDEPETDDDT